MKDYGGVHDDDDHQNEGGARSWREFECPDCNAHNPYDDGFRIGDEVLCNYCGLTFEVRERGTHYVLREV